MRVPPGFRVHLFAAEPDVVQPVGFCFDDRGRLWVAEAHHYPQHGTEPGDRILILEDSDNDGKHDRRTVFTDQVNYITGIEVGFGGVWVMSPPYFYFFPDRDQDDQPDGPPEVLLDGFGNHANSHNLANGFAWGPDGWLYGTHGRTNWSLIGTPGTPTEARARFDGGVYRYHPVRRVWEAYADGTTNPWGIDWNDVGDAFVTNCVTPHLYHVIRGAHYEPWRSRESSRYAYQRLATIADHRHYAGAADDVRGELGSAAEDLLGGGHAHCGALIYLGDMWPAAYRNTILLHNIHGHRINNDLLVPSRSGYVGKHGADVMVSQDPWFMGVTLALGPDGAVYSADWSDTGECHSMVNTQRETGRIFKITYGADRPPLNQNWRNAPGLDLAHWQASDNEWMVRHARRILQERAARNEDVSDARAWLQEQLADSAQATRVRLRCLWALQGIDALGPDALTKLLDDADPHLRGMAVRLAANDPAALGRLIVRIRQLAREEPSAAVRLEIASSLQQLPHDQRWTLLEELARRDEDGDDPNLPLMLWYAMEPLADVDPRRFADLALRTRLPYLREHAARRLLERTTLRLEDAVQVLAERLPDASAETQVALLAGMRAGLSGVRTMPAPENWDAIFASLQQAERVEVREGAVDLALVFADPNAVARLRQQVEDPGLAAEVRAGALRKLTSRRPTELRTLLEKALDEPGLQIVAIQGLASLNDPDITQLLAARITTTSPPMQAQLLAALASRPAGALHILDAVEGGRLARAAVDASMARQMDNLNDPVIRRRLTQVWGTVRPSSAERRQLLQAYQRRYTAESLASADRAQGRVVFQQACAACHRLFGSGELLGPDLTGAQRNHLDYLLENLLDPSASVSADYQMERFELSDGRVVTGLVVDESGTGLTVRTQQEQLVIPSAEITERTRSSTSFMPDGILTSLTERQRRDLLAYLMGPTQVALPSQD